MSERPSFQFYPGDWQSNPNLKRCSFAEKGVWLEVMCLMHDQPEYGVLRWPLKEIAEAVKCRPADLQGLIRKGVLKGDDKQLHEPYIYTPRSGRKDGDPVTLLDTQAGPIWYSSRMVKDEYVRTIRAESAAKGEASKATPKASPKGGLGATKDEAFGGGFGPRGSSSSSSSPSSENFVLSESDRQAAFAACGSALKRAGINLATVNTSDPVYRALVEQGMTPDELEPVAKQAVEKRIAKPLPWICTVVQDRRAKAAEVKLAPKSETTEAKPWDGAI